MDFPHPCTRCGFCCLAEACPVAQKNFGIGRHDPCPALSFDEQGQSTCMVAACAIRFQEVIGVGVGCCVKARLVYGGKTHDFAALPPETKRAAVKAVRERSVTCRATR